LVDAATKAEIYFRAVVADCFYGDNRAFTRPLEGTGLPYVLGMKPKPGIWTPAEAIPSPREAAVELHWESPDKLSGWTPVVRSCRDAIPRPGGQSIWSMGRRPAFNGVPSPP
jgi:SRSO17 transposase